MKNEKGITLVELLAALAIVGIITAVIASVLTTGTSSADRTASKQQLQQEANYIVEAIRAEYLKGNKKNISISVTAESIALTREGELKKTISQVYEYELLSKNIIDPSKNEKFHLILKDGTQTYEIKTTFSKLR